MKGNPVKKTIILLMFVGAYSFGADKAPSKGDVSLGIICRSLSGGNNGVLQEAHVDQDEISNKKEEAALVAKSASAAAVAAQVTSTTAPPKKPIKARSASTEESVSAAAKVASADTQPKVPFFTGSGWIWIDPEECRETGEFLAEQLRRKAENQEAIEMNRLIQAPSVMTRTEDSNFVMNCGNNPSSTTNSNKTGCCKLLVNAGVKAVQTEDFRRGGFVDCMLMVTCCLPCLLHKLRKAEDIRAR